MEGDFQQLYVLNMCQLILHVARHWILFIFSAVGVAFWWLLV